MYVTKIVFLEIFSRYNRPRKVEKYLLSLLKFQLYGSTQLLKSDFFRDLK